MTPLHRFKAEFFKALAHPLRLAILDALREGEKSVSQLIHELRAEQSTLSQQLALLKQKRLLESRREGTMVFYRPKDPEVYAFLDLGRRIFERQLKENQVLLEALVEESHGD